MQSDLLSLGLCRGVPDNDCLVKTSTEQKLAGRAPSRRKHWAIMELKRLLDLAICVPNASFAIVRAGRQQSTVVL